MSLSSTNNSADLYLEPMLITWRADAPLLMTHAGGGRVEAKVGRSVPGFADRTLGAIRFLLSRYERA